MRIGDADFEHAVGLILERLREAAARPGDVLDGWVTYKELSDWLAERGVHVPYHDGPLPHLLGAASEREHAQQRGMISALVVEQGTRQPSTGFYRLARGAPFHRVGDDQTLWWREVERVRAEHGG